MQSRLNIALVQSDLVWQNTQKNLSVFEDLFQSISKTDLIVLPEMFNSGFSMHPESFAEVESGGKVVEWMKRMAVKHSSALIGSVAVKWKDKFLNRLFFVDSNGSIQTYDKRHLFRMAGENKGFEAGHNKLIVTCKGWKICPLVCYDLRFPVWSRNQYTDGVYDYDLLIYVANWPSVRTDAWQTLLKARAIENLSYTVGVNRVGEDENGFAYSGDSRCFSFTGERLENIESNKISITQIELDKDDLNSFRRKFPTGLDADTFKITL